jgi:hypothetical protein
MGRTVTFRELESRWSWRPIPGCPGRWVLSAGPSHVPPEDMVSRDVRIAEHRVAAVKDPVIVVSLDDGGLISYRKPGGTFVHTLNSREGFERKLRQLGIDLP